MPPADIGAKPLSAIPRSSLRGGFILGQNGARFESGHRATNAYALSLSGKSICPQGPSR